jgi:hypothetical protein
VARHAFLSGTRLTFVAATAAVLAAAIAARFPPAREEPSRAGPDLDQDAIALEVERLPP